jgi:hypothetical protein
MWEFEMWNLILNMQRYIVGKEFAPLSMNSYVLPKKFAKDRTEKQLQQWDTLYYNLLLSEEYTDVFIRR